MQQICYHDFDQSDAISSYTAYAPLGSVTRPDSLPAAGASQASIATCHPALHTLACCHSAFGSVVSRKWSLEVLAAQVVGL